MSVRVLIDEESGGLVCVRCSRLSRDVADALAWQDVPVDAAERDRVCPGCITSEERGGLDEQLRGRR